MFLSFLKRYIVDFEAATAIEYALLASGVALAISVVVFGLGDEILAIFNAIGDGLDQAAEEAAS